MNKWIGLSLGTLFKFERRESGYLKSAEKEQTTIPISPNDGDVDEELPDQAN